MKVVVVVLLVLGLEQGLGLVWVMFGTGIDMRLGMVVAMVGGAELAMGMCVAVDSDIAMGSNRSLLQLAASLAHADRRLVASPRLQPRSRGGHVAATNMAASPVPLSAARFNRAVYVRVCLTFLTSQYSLLQFTSGVQVSCELAKRARAQQRALSQGFFFF